MAFCHHYSHLPVAVFLPKVIAPGDHCELRGLIQSFVTTPVVVGEYIVHMNAGLVCAGLQRAEAPLETQQARYSK